MSRLKRLFDTDLSEQQELSLGVGPERAMEVCRDAAVEDLGWAASPGEGEGTLTIVEDFTRLKPNDYPIRMQLRVRPENGGKRSTVSLVASIPGVGERGFRDGSPHRAELPSAYQGYRLTDGDPLYEQEREPEQMLFWPLFFTSWLIDDQIADEGFYEAETIVLSSASSKTAIIAAFQLAQRDDAPKLIGLTSPGNREFVEGLGIYDGVVAYDEIGELPDGKAAYVDMSGDGEVRWDVHERYGDALTHDMPVGMSHHEQLSAGRNGKLKGPTPEFFFAPVRGKKRASDWGGRELDDRMAADWKPFVDFVAGWLEVRNSSGPEGLKETYLEVLEGRVPPQVGHVVSL